MKRIRRGKILTAMLGVVLFCGVLFRVYAEDMRESAVAVEEKKAALLKAVEQEKLDAEKEARESRERIWSDKTKLTAAVNALEAKAAILERDNNEIEKKLALIIQQEKQLNDAVSEGDTVLGELVGVIRISARDLNAITDQSLQTAFSPEPVRRLETLSDQSTFPGMEDIQELVGLYFKEMDRSGEVRTGKGPFINASGEEVVGDILVLGNFSAAYRLNGEVGFLNYTPENHRLLVLSKSAGRRMKNKIIAYMNGKSVDVPIDISKGGALRQLVQGTSLFEKIPQGGPIVWPILAILVAAVVITLERLISLGKKKINSQGFMKDINDMISAGKWEESRKYCEDRLQKPLANVVLAGIKFNDMKREDMENAIQEAILREIPPLEKFLSTLGMLAAIAPLLGLLGTVTGMINTFHMITFYGTGDPRMMSGGISEALVTTMLGLMVAIPIMFVHNLLSRRVETTIGEMEEKAVSFINMVFKTQVNTGVRS